MAAQASIVITPTCWVPARRVPPERQILPLFLNARPTNPAQGRPE
jgi:hypothetical protein